MTPSFPRPRREFLRLGASMALGLAFAPAAKAVEPFVRGGASRLRLSLAAYSFRDDFVAPKGAPVGTGPKLDMFKFLDFCAEHGCDGAELTSYYFPEPVTPDHLTRIHRHAHLRGVTVSGTAVGNNFTHPPGPARDREVASVKRWIANAVMLGAPHIRVFAGEAQKGQSRADAVRECVAALEECGEIAGRHGIFLGLENHGGIVATPEELLEVVRALKSPWIGVNLDTGNFHTDDPYADLARCAPYAVNVQFKAEIRRRGATRNEPADTARVMRILRDANYQGWVALEYEMAEDPWQKVPGLLGELRRHMG